MIPFERERLIVNSAKVKLKTLDELVKIREQLRREKKSVVFTNGCFDVLHSGHIYLLEQAKLLGDVSILALNTDEYIRKIKGPNRPINCAYDRAQILSALESLDFITFFEEDTPCEIIDRLRPDIHVKGSDYNPQDFSNMPESEVILKYGGEIKIIKFLRGYSSTRIIDRFNPNKNK